MKILCAVVIIASTYFVVTSCEFLSDDVRQINFTKVDGDSDEYDFEYDLECDTFRGRTFFVTDASDHIYILFGADDILYWVKFTDEEYRNQKYLTKPVRLIERNEDKLIFRDDFNDYNLIVSRATLLVEPYQTKWDLEKICFFKSAKEYEMFNYTISATNNLRRYNGTTFYASNDPHVQRIHLNDGPQRNDTYEVNFTDDEIDSNDTFCKGISKILSESGVLGAYPVSNINPNLLKSLAG